VEALRGRLEITESTADDDERRRRLERLKALGYLD
jgi:hypothetical protein